jgi:hypothetical protein
MVMPIHYEGLGWLWPADTKGFDGYDQPIRRALMVMPNRNEGLGWSCLAETKGLGGYDHLLRWDLTVGIF